MELPRRSLIQRPVVLALTVLGLGAVGWLVALVVPSTFELSICEANVANAQAELRFLLRAERDFRLRSGAFTDDLRLLDWEPTADRPISFVYGFHDLGVRPSNTASPYVVRALHLDTALTFTTSGRRIVGSALPATAFVNASNLRIAAVGNADVADDELHVVTINGHGMMQTLADDCAP